MIAYVVGLLFDELPGVNRMIALRKKRGPPHLIGRLNGPGGQVKNETALEAMVREAREEVGLEIDWKILQHVVTLWGEAPDGSPYKIFYFYARVNINVAKLYKQSPTDERGCIIWLGEILTAADVVEDLRLIIPLVLSEQFQYPIELRRRPEWDAS